MLFCQLVWGSTRIGLHASMLKRIILSLYISAEPLSASGKSTSSSTSPKAHAAVIGQLADSVVIGQMLFLVSMPLFSGTCLSPSRITKRKFRLTNLIEWP